MNDVTQILVTGGAARPVPPAAGRPGHPVVYRPARPGEVPNRGFPRL